jgi:hypothetical protein
LSPVDRLRRTSLPTLAALALVACGAPAVAGKVTDLFAGGATRELRKRPDGARPRSPDLPAILLIAFDGVDRATLYDLLRKNKLPSLARLLGGEALDADGPVRFGHAHLDERMLSTLPSSTMAAWTTAMTGLPPAAHGVTGNEYFIRESRRLAAPAPVTFGSAKPTLSIYTDAYLDGLKSGPSVYDRMRERDPDVLVWVAMHSIYSGADRLLVTKPTILARAFEHLMEGAIATAKIEKDDVEDRKRNRNAYEVLDKQVVDVVVGALEKGPLPDVLTVYLSGTDLYAHIAQEGPDEARRTYLTDVADPALGLLAERLEQRHALADRFVVVTSDHGHTQVLRDKEHALSADGPDDPPALMKKAGFRLRPFELDVSARDGFDAVWAAGGAMAYVYLADRSTCPTDRTPCDWSRPPRYEEDVLPMADAFYRADRDGALVPEMKGVLDLVMVRRAKPYAEIDLPFEVYVGGGKTEPLEAHLARHPHPTYIDMPARLRDLAVGPHGERAGDVLLLAHNGDRDDPRGRYYFAELYRSWHGSPSRRDSEIPFIVAHRAQAAEALARRVERHLGRAPYQQKVTDVLLDLRFGTAESAAE